MLQAGIKNGCLVGRESTMHVLAVPRKPFISRWRREKRPGVWYQPPCPDPTDPAPGADRQRLPVMEEAFIGRATPRRPWDAEISRPDGLPWLPYQSQGRQTMGRRRPEVNVPWNAWFCPDRLAGSSVSSLCWAVFTG